MVLTRLLVLLLALCAVPARAIEPFIIKDIRVEGIQRTEAGTVFSYLPVKVGDTMDDEKASQAIRALFATGFFRDVTLEVDNGVLVVVASRQIDSQIEDIPIAVQAALFAGALLVAGGGAYLVRRSGRPPSSSSS